MTDSTKGSLKVNRNMTTLRVLTLEKMRTAILNGYFKPGERLIERQLCEQLEVSRTVVREVLRHLEAEGLVDTVTHQGPVVAVLNPDEAAQIYEIRALLEGQAARWCCERADAATLDRLDAINATIQAAFEQDDFHEVLQRTTAFYEAMFQAAGASVAWGVVQTLNARINRLRAMTISHPGRGQDAAQEMARILQALRLRDADAAAQASSDHVRRVAALAAQKLSAA